MAKEKTMTKIKNLVNTDGWEEITKILKSRRDELAVKILYHTGIDEKIYSESDHMKLEIRMLNKIINVPELEIPYERELTEEELLAQDTDELDIGEVEDLFKTRE